MNDLPTHGRRLILGGLCCRWPRQGVVIPESATEHFARRHEAEKARWRGGIDASEDQASHRGIVSRWSFEVHEEEGSGGASGIDTCPGSADLAGPAGDRPDFPTRGQKAVGTFSPQREVFG